MIKEIGSFLRQSILNAFNSSQALPWPLLPSNFQNNDSVVPEDLKKILGFVMFGSNMSNAHQFEICAINSIGQDICRAATWGQWKLHEKNISSCQ